MVQLVYLEWTKLVVTNDHMRGQSVYCLGIRIVQVIRLTERLGEHITDMIHIVRSSSGCLAGSVYLSTRGFLVVSA